MSSTPGNSLTGTGSVEVGIAQLEAEAHRPSGEGAHVTSAFPHHRALDSHRTSRGNRPGQTRESARRMRPDLDAQRASRRGGG